MKKILVLSIIAFSFSFFVGHVHADSSQATQKALESAKQFLDDLVTTKDDSSGDDVGLRIETFSQVLDLSTNEVKDFKLKLLTADKDATLEGWKDNALNGLDQSLSFIDSQRSLISKLKSIDLKEIRNIAQNFKSWRDNQYMPLVNEIQGFLLIKQEAKAVQTAQARLEKIMEDLKNLNQTKISGSGDINNSLTRSKQGVADATDLNGQAYDLFNQNYGAEVISIASSTDVWNSISSADFITTSSGATSADIGAAAYSTSTATSSETAAGSSNPPIVSIKDLVRSSLSKIKDAYQGFIDISNLVRKLLG